MEGEELFRAGERYRDYYHVQHTIPFLTGQLAVASAQHQRYYLQSVAALRQPSTQVVQQYRSLSHMAWMPVTGIYYEDRYLILVRPFLLLTSLGEALARRGKASEGVAVEWGRTLLDLALLLECQPVPMQLLLDLRNLGVTEHGNLKVFSCGTPRVVTGSEQGLDWSTWFVAVLQAELHEEPMLSFPSSLDVSRPMRRFLYQIQGERDPSVVMRCLREYERRRSTYKWWSRKKNLRREARDFALDETEPGLDRGQPPPSQLPAQFSVPVARDRRRPPSPIAPPRRPVSPPGLSLEAPGSGSLLPMRLQGEAMAQGLEWLLSLPPAQRQQWEGRWQQLLRETQFLWEEQRLWEQRAQLRTEQRRMRLLQKEQDLLQELMTEVQAQQAPAGPEEEGE